MFGILGGVGSGKSSVVRHVHGLNLQVIDADRIGHDLLTDADIREKIREAFGDSVFDDSDSVERSRLACIVFGDSKESKSALSKLNQIMHPAIRMEIYRQIRSANSSTDAIVLDAALLLEGGWDATCDWLIFIDAAREIRIQRVQENRGWSADELDRREANQIPVHEKKQKADFEVNNSGSLENAASQMKKIFDSVLSNRRNTHSL